MKELGRRKRRPFLGFPSYLPRVDLRHLLELLDAETVMLVVALPAGLTPVIATSGMAPAGHRDRGDDR